MLETGVGVRGGGLCRATTITQRQSAGGIRRILSMCVVCVGGGSAGCAVRCGSPSDSEVQAWDSLAWNGRLVSLSSSGQVQVRVGSYLAAF